MRIPQLVLFAEGVSAMWMSWGYHECDSSSSITSFTSVPSVPNLGYDFSFDLKIKVPEDTTGGQISVSGSYTLGYFGPMKLDLCKTAINTHLPMGLGHVSTGGFKCPQKAGADVDINIAAWIGRGLGYSVPSASWTMHVTNQAGKEIACMVGHYVIHGWWDDETAERPRKPKSLLPRPLSKPVTEVYI